MNLPIRLIITDEKKLNGEVKTKLNLYADGNEEQNLLTINFLKKYLKLEKKKLEVKK